MAGGRLQGVMRKLHSAAAEGIGGLTDGQLLERFVTRRDEGSFELLVWRHGAMVLATCRRVLRNPADAEDAFQATFLVFLRRAATIGRREAVAGWLHRVALRTALRLRTQTAAAADAPPAEPRTAAGPDEVAAGNEVRAALDEEVARLPERQRGPFVLCYLEGKTAEEAARTLGCPRGTVLSRLARARDRLRANLTRRGVVPSAAAIAAAASGATAAVPVPLVDATVKAAMCDAAGAATGVVSGRVLTLTEGVLTAMSRTKLYALAAVLVGCALVAGGAVALTPSVVDPPPVTSLGSPQPEKAAKVETDDQRATRLGLAVHAQAAAVGKLPRFDYQVRSRWASVAIPRAVDVPLETRIKVLTAPVPDKDWFGWFEKGLSWDEKRVIHQLRPGQADLNLVTRFGTATDGWDRSGDKEKTGVRFTRRAGVGEYWDDPDSAGRTYMGFFEFSHLRLTRHRFWWGSTSTKTNAHVMCFVPLDQLTWASLKAELFAGELCDVVESTVGKTDTKSQRFWVSQKTGRVRGVLAYLGEESPNENELVQFDDYREVSPGVWLPFREVRSYGFGKNLTKLNRSELVVTEARPGVDLAGRYGKLLPGEGDRVQDQRFAAPVWYEYSAKRTDDEIRKLADAEHKRQLQGQEVFQRLVKPLDALVGKPAPALPKDGWVGGPRPDVAGKPYLVHFWATWCGPCKGDLPRLRALAEKGFTIVGMHPAGTPAGDVEKVILDQKLGYPTFLAAGNANAKTVGGYPAAVFPYCVLIDAEGRVAKHGLLADVLGAVEAEVRHKALAGKAAPALDAGRWLNTPDGLNLEGLTGKVVLMDFWGQWCGPCVKTMPQIEELHVKFKDRGLVVVGVHTPDRSDKLDAFLKEKKVSFPVVIDGGETATRYCVEGWPTYFLIDRKGNVVWGHSNEPPTADRIERLLDQK